MVKKNRLILTALVVVLFCGIGFLIHGKHANEYSKEEKEQSTPIAEVAVSTSPVAVISNEVTVSKTPTLEPTNVPTVTTSQKESETKNSKHIIVIDAGHQAKADSSQEPIGPGAKETKKKVSSGTQGRFTGVPEYEVNLQVAKKLEKALTKLNYTVIMVRETNDVNISNSERAEIANDNDADMLIRIHCNGSEDASVNGILTICPTKKNKYCKHIYEDSRRLADCLLEGLLDATKANSRGVTETDSMSGINWSLVPVVIVEMGYMTNEEEDNKLVTSEYQNQLVEGMVKGIQSYLEEKE